MSWFFLGLAIAFEVAGTTCLKLASGLSRLLPSIGIFLFYGIAFSFAALAIKKIELSTAYAIWSGVGTALAAVIGIVYFKESMGWLKILSIALIAVGVVGLNLSTRLP